MAKKELESTIQIAQKLVNHLPKEMDDELKLLIRRAEEGHDTTIEVIDLLSTHDVVRLWMLEQFNMQSGGKGTTRGYGPLAGWQGSVPASKKWVCPKADCPESLPVIQAGEEAPTCRVHGAKMVCADQKNG